MRRNALALRAVDALRALARLGVVSFKLAVPSRLGVSVGVDAGVVILGIVSSEAIKREGYSRYSSQSCSSKAVRTSFIQEVICSVCNMGQYLKTNCIFSSVAMLV